MTTVSKAPSRVLVLLVSVVVASFLLLASAVQARGTGPATDSLARDNVATAKVATASVPATGTSEVRVSAGDTLWAIASDVAEPGEDVRKIIHDIKRLNDLDGSIIHPGQVLTVPIDG